VVVQEKLLTVQEFDEFVMRPENANRLFEYVGGKYCRGGIESIFIQDCVTD
jgi:hypothetical protein